MAAAYALIAGTIVSFGAPKAAGSGMPEIKVLIVVCSARMQSPNSVLDVLVHGFGGMHARRRHQSGVCMVPAQAYFNGVHMTGLLTLRTLVAKLVSAMFVLAAGLIAEGEAPFVHLGAIVGGGIASTGSG
jgi:H+/Cl- antiporter ClcA